MRFVKSYRGKRPDTNETQTPAMVVGDFMATKLITFNPDQSMHEVISILIKQRISGAPVVNEKNELVGIISEGDCLKQISESRYHNLLMTEAKVSQYMAKNVKTIDQDLSIFDAASKFLNSKIRRFPVMHEGKLVGQISQKDIMKAVLELSGTNYSQQTP